jgi:hypothetical protein
MTRKEIILKLNYKLFLGKQTGPIKKCMIESIKKLALILEKNDSSMTIFWDILLYYLLLVFEMVYSELKQDRVLINEWILNLAKREHDTSLRLHPHWLNAKYENSN